MFIYIFQLLGPVHRPGTPPQQIHPEPVVPPDSGRGGEGVGAGVAGDQEGAGDDAGEGGQTGGERNKFSLLFFIKPFTHYACN